MKKYALMSTAVFCLAILFLWLAMQFDSQRRYGQNASIGAENEAEKYVQHKYSNQKKESFYRNLSKAVQFETISAKGIGSSKDAFNGFNNLLRETYPLSMNTLKQVYKSEHSQLLSLEGRNTDLAPVLLIAHSDVVPVQTRRLTKDTSSKAATWQYPPFAGEMDEEHIWGRGALDNKSAILAMLEAMELRTQEGKGRPERTIYFAFTHDEEVGGHLGAKRLARYMREKGIRPYFVLDEGQAVTQGIVPNVKKPVALVGVTQKGYMTVELSVKGEPGHSMLPPKATAIAKLSEAIYRLNESPMPPEMTSPIKAMFRQLSHHMSFPKNLMLYHTWLTEPVVSSQLSKKKTTDALIRTSMSVNVINGGVAENVLPKSASALVNYRIAPHNTSDELLAHIEEAIAGTEVQFKVVSAIEEPSPISSHEHDAYHRIAKVIHNVFSDAIIAPSITLATTDSRHFADLTEQVFRFSPIFLKKEDLSRFHGINERISKHNYIQMIDFYRGLYDSI